VCLMDGNYVGNSYILPVVDFLMHHCMSYVKFNITHKREWNSLAVADSR